MEQSVYTPVSGSKSTKDTHMDNWEERLFDAIESLKDKVETRLDNIEVKQTEMNKDLEHHIRRTELNEEAIQVLREHTDESLESIKDSLAPLNRHLNGLKYIGWAISAAGILAGAITKIMNLW